MVFKVILPKDCYLVESKDLNVPLWLWVFFFFLCCIFFKIGNFIYACDKLGFFFVGFTLNYRRSYKRCLSSVKRKAWRGHESYRLLSGILQSVCLSKCLIYPLSSCWRVVDRNNFVLIKVWTVRSCISQVMWDHVFHGIAFVWSSTICCCNLARQI